MKHGPVFTKGLIRVVDKNGKVWWLKPMPR